MRFLLYNIRYAAGIGRQFHLPVPYSGYFKRTNENLKNILDFIKSVNPDIIGLVEVDSGSFRSQKNNQAEGIAWELQLDHIYQSKYPAKSMAQKLPLTEKTGQCHPDQPGNHRSEVSLFSPWRQTPGHRT